MRADKPPDGYTLDGRIHINEYHLARYLDEFAGPGLMPNGSLANVDIPPTEITNVDAFTFDLANVVPFAEDYFALATDTAKRPLSWLFELNASAPDYLDYDHPEGFFDGPTGYLDTDRPGTASYGKLLKDNDLTIVNWTGQGGKLSSCRCARRRRPAAACRPLPGRACSCWEATFRLS